VITLLWLDTLVGGAGRDLEPHTDTPEEGHVPVSGLIRHAYLYRERNKLGEAALFVGFGDAVVDVAAEFPVGSFSGCGLT
jgi:hypothetical protein